MPYGVFICTCQPCPRFRETTHVNMACDDGPRVSVRFQNFAHHHIHRSFGFIGLRELDMAPAVVKLSRPLGRSVEPVNDGGVKAVLAKQVLNFHAWNLEVDAADVNNASLTDGTFMEGAHIAMARYGHDSRVLLMDSTMQRCEMSGI